MLTWIRTIYKNLQHPHVYTSSKHATKHTDRFKNHQQSNQINTIFIHAYNHYTKTKNYNYIDGKKRDNKRCNQKLTLSELRTHCIRISHETFHCADKPASSVSPYLYLFMARNTSTLACISSHGANNIYPPLKSFR